MADLAIDDPSYSADRVDRYKIDYQDSKALWAFAMRNCQIAEQYQDARALHATALKNLKLRLSKEYRLKHIDPKIAEDKAYLIMAENDDEVRDMLRDLIEKRSIYKGLEKLMEARAAALSFNQSLIKNEARHT